jgi:hypothetical protein
VIEELVAPRSTVSRLGKGVNPSDAWLHARIFAVGAVLAFERGDHFSCMALANDAVFIFGRDGMRTSMTEAAAKRRSAVAAKGGKARTREDPIDPLKLNQFRDDWLKRYGKERGWQTAAATELRKSNAAITKAWKKAKEADS